MPFIGADLNPHPQSDGSNQTHRDMATHANPCTASHTFAQHPAQGELLLWDEYILQFVLQLITDAQAVHCGEAGGEKGEGPLWFQIQNPACLLHPRLHPQSRDELR